MNLTEAQIEKMKSTFKFVEEYKGLIKDHQGSCTEAMSALLDELCPKIEGKADAATKARNKDDRKEAKQLIADTFREYMRDRDNKPDTTPEALVAYEKLQATKG